MDKDDFFFNIWVNLVTKNMKIIDWKLDTVNPTLYALSPYIYVSASLL